MGQKNLPKYATASNIRRKHCWNHLLSLVGILCSVVSQSLQWTIIREKKFSLNYEDKTEYYCDVIQTSGTSVLNKTRKIHVVKFDGISHSEANNYTSIEKFFFVSIELDALNRENLEFYFYSNYWQAYWFMN